MESVCEIPILTTPGESIFRRHRETQDRRMPPAICDRITAMPAWPVIRKAKKFDRKIGLPKVILRLE